MFARFSIFLFSLFSTFVVVACSTASTPANTPTENPATDPPATQIPPTALPASDIPTTELAAEQVEATCEDPFEGVRVSFNKSSWPDTDFCKHSVPLSEFFSGGPPPDGIPPIDAPKFETVARADEWLEAKSPVVVFSSNDDVRAYPLAILMWHEIVNDEVGGEPVTVTFCPLCNATIVFKRTLPNGNVLDFGTSGNLRNSDLVMYDRQTRSWWQQFTGEAIVGEMTGTQLEFLPSQIIGWDQFKQAHPNGQVLSRSTGFVRDYGSNPYVGYDSIDNNPFLYFGVVDGRLAAMERVVAVQIEDTDIAYPFSELERVRVVNDDVNGTPLVVFWATGTKSALDSSSIDNSADVGATAVFSPIVDGQTLRFEPTMDGFRDVQTNSTWNMFGEAIGGELTGTQLEQVVAAEHFWFAWAAFKPDSLIWTGVGG